MLMVEDTILSSFFRGRTFLCPYHVDMIYVSERKKILDVI